MSVVPNRHPCLVSVDLQLCFVSMLVHRSVRMEFRQSYWSVQDLLLPDLVIDEPESVVAAQITVPVLGVKRRS